jgi:hypothetical protein
LYSQAYSSSWQHQIAGDYRSGQIALRGKNNGTFQAWRTVLDSSNYTSYAPSLTGSGASGNWGINVTGNAATVTNGVYTNSSAAISGDNHITFGPNSTWASSLRVGGNGRTATGAMASVVTTNGNLHLDPASGSFATYLSFYAGGNGVAFGNGSSGIVAWMGPDGDLWKGSSDNTGTQYVQNSGTWGISVTGNAATATTASNTTSISSAVGTGYTWTGIQQFQSNQNTSGSNPPLQAYSSSGGAIMSFHRGGQYAVNMGLDSDNVFRIGGWSAPANLLQMDMSGNLTMANNVTAYSDIRLKEDLEPIPDAIEKVQSLTGYTYTRIDSGQRQTGLIAQEVQKVLPEAVMDNGEHLSLAYGNMVGLLIEAIKAQQVQIDELRAKLGV